ncbi:MAG TPA: hypothetical protein VF498_11220 [Anaerolineales bacterium]
MIFFQHFKDWMLWRTVDLLFLLGYALMLVLYGWKQLFRRKGE